MTRKEQLLEAFRDAGRRGLTGREMDATVGTMWRLRLRELAADGCVFLEHESKTRPGTTFRWSLVAELTPVAGDDATPALFDAAELAPPAADDALFGDVS